LETVGKYQEDVEHVFDKYIQLYFDAYPDEKTPLTAQEFLSINNDKYRAEVNNIALSSFRNNDYDKATHDQILQLNDQNVVRLYEKIMEISREG